MTREEQLEKELEEERAKNQKLEGNIREQNSYITKLEGKISRGDTAPQQPANAQTTQALDPTLQKYLENTMREDIISKAIIQIKSEVTEEEYLAIESDFKDFLNRNMTKANVSIEYVTDAFSLIYGRARRDKNHPINAIGAKGTTPNTTAATVDIGSNHAGIDAVNRAISQKPPIMTGADSNASANPPDAPNTVTSTRDAFKSLKDKFGQLGANRFS